MVLFQQCGPTLHAWVHMSSPGQVKTSKSIPLARFPLPLAITAVWVKRPDGTNTRCITLPPIKTADPSPEDHQHIPLLYPHSQQYDFYGALFVRSTTNNNHRSHLQIDHPILEVLCHSP